MLIAWGLTTPQDKEHKVDKAFRRVSHDSGKEEKREKKWKRTDRMMCKSGELTSRS